MGKAAQLSYALWPKLNDSVLNRGFRLFPSSAAARGRREDSKPSLEQTVFTSVFRGGNY